MIIGSVVEVRPEEKKIALTPSLTRTLTDLGHKVIIQKNLGKLSGFSDNEFKKNGAEVLNSAQEVYSQADIMVKINQPTSDEYDFLKKNQIIFSFFKYSNKNDLMNVVREKKITTINFANVKNNYGNYPFLKAGSEIVGKTLIRIASSVAEKYMGGALLGGASGIAPLKITVIGAGTVGFNAAKTAAAIGADVSILDTNPYLLRKIEEISCCNIKTYFSNRENLENLLSDTDILICAVKRKNKKLPPIVTYQDVKSMKKGSLIIDAGLASDNIVVETMDRVLSAENPVYENEGILYFCNPDIASMAAKTVSSAVAETLAPYISSVVSCNNFIEALRENRELISGVMTYDGNITDEKTADMFEEEVYELSMLTGF